MTDKTPQDDRRREKPAPWVTGADAAAVLALVSVFIVCVAAILIRQNAVGDDVRVERGGREPAPYRVDLNRAPVQELTLLPGIGRIRSERIVEWRREHGPFRSLEEVGRATGLAAKGIARLREFVTLGETVSERAAEPDLSGTQ